ncbi:MAG: PilZ domain-containing protein, partial [Gemmataceae bacterium]
RHRRHVRYARHLDILWQLLGYNPKELTNARMMDLSKSGVAVVVSQPVEVKTHLILRLPTTTHGWSTHLVQVQNCLKLEDGQYKIGCRFVKPLSEEQLAFHLE